MGLGLRSQCVVAHFKQVERVYNRFFLSRYASMEASFSPMLKHPDSMTVATEINTARGMFFNGRPSRLFDRLPMLLSSYVFLVRWTLRAA